MVSPPPDHGLAGNTFGGVVLDIVLGVSMAPASIQMVVLEGENADGATVEEDEFDVTAAADSAIASGPDQVIAAILGTREGAADAGLELSSIGVTWTDQTRSGRIARRAGRLQARERDAGLGVSCRDSAGSNRRRGNGLRAHGGAFRRA